MLKISELLFPTLKIQKNDEMKGGAAGRAEARQVKGRRQEVFCRVRILVHASFRSVHRKRESLPGFCEWSGVAARSAGAASEAAGSTTLS